MKCPHCANELDRLGFGRKLRWWCWKCEKYVRPVKLMACQHEAPPYPDARPAWRDWFRAGYWAALNDIERTGLQPMTDATIRESADRALKRWVDLIDDATGSLPDESELTND